MGKYNVIGLMSGSSMDGLDIVYCRFEGSEYKWNYEILKSDVFRFPNKWKLRLENLVMQNAITYLKTHTFFGHYLAEIVNDFIAGNDIRNEVDFIANHGQTIFHQPENLLTSQIGDNAAIAAITGLPVIGNFRNKDVALGGLGTPLAPIGDLVLFSSYSHCLNLGGFANISFKKDERDIIGYDICAVNLLLNKLAELKGESFDRDGGMAASGNISQELLEELNESWYFDKDYPKSLGGGWVMKVILPILQKYELTAEDKLRTVCEHIAMQIAMQIRHIYEKEGMEQGEKDKMLATGGGARNKFLMERIREHSPIPVEIPNEKTIDLKEAIIIGLMGVLRVENKENFLSGVTGAKHDTIGGEIFQGKDKVI